MNTITIDELTNGNYPDSGSGALWTVPGISLDNGTIAAVVRDPSGERVTRFHMGDGQTWNYKGKQQRPARAVQHNEAGAYTLTLKDPNGDKVRITYDTSEDGQVVQWRGAVKNGYGLGYQIMS